MTTMNNMEGSRLRPFIYCCLLFTVYCLARCEKCTGFQVGRPVQVQVNPRARGPVYAHTRMSATSTDESRATTVIVTNRRRAIRSTSISIASSIAVSFVLTGGSRPSTALSPEAASTAYDTYASSYDELDGGSAASILGLDAARSDLFQQAKGNVLEIGAGTGLNLSKYTASVSSLTLVDISQGMLQEAKSRATALDLPFPIDYIKADATSQLVDLFGENAFDTVVDSFSLCVMGNEGAKSCLEQLTKVVKAESGSILLLENSRSSNPLLAKYQDVTAEAAASAGGKGCVYNQDVPALIKATQGLTIEKETSYVTGLFRSFKCVKHVTPVPNR